MSFFISALVELLGYIVVHAILDRIGRKIPYISFVILFSIVSFLILPVQYLMEKDGKSLSKKILFFSKIKLKLRSNNVNEYNKWYIEIFSISILCNYLYLC
jgi:hypothetical protein